MTLRDRMIAALLTRGYVQVATASRAYIKMSHPSTDRFLFLGKAGSLRRGFTKTSSIPADRLKAELLAETVKQPVAT